MFRVQVVSSPDVRSPVITLGSTSFFHVRHENLYVVAVTKCNANAALVFEFCNRVVKLCVNYFGKMDEEAIKSNFTLIYELIDGMCSAALVLAARDSAFSRGAGLWLPPEHRH
jgi:AP-2 complex subunit mu-1